LVDNSLLNASAGTAALIMNVISKRKESFKSEDANGPAFCNVPQTANPDKISAMVAVCCGGSRSAAHNSGGLSKIRAVADR
jgi:hypothetical protein